MADTDSRPLIPEHTKRVSLVLATLFLYSIAMFTLPFAAFFGVRHIMTEVYPMDRFIVNVWSVLAAVVTANIIICVYAYKAYHEKEYDEDGNEIDQHAYTDQPPVEAEKSSLNLKQD